MAVPVSSIARYEIVRTVEGWTIFHDDKPESVRETKMAAFDAVVAAASTSILEGYGVFISVATEAAEEVAPKA